MRCIIRLFNNEPASAQRRIGERHHRAKPYQAVTIYHRRIMLCPAADAAAGQSYPAEDAPVLPLTDCISPT